MTIFRNMIIWTNNTSMDARIRIMRSSLNEIHYKYFHFCKLRNTNLRR